LRWQFVENTSSITAGVFLVNLIGVAVAGFVAYRINPTQEQRLFWITGFAGGFTTLSSFALILHESSPLKGFLIASVSFLLSLLILNFLRPKVRQ